MKFGKSILTPSYFRKPDFDSVGMVENSFKFICVNCQKKVEIEFESIIGKEWSWHDKFDEKTNTEIKQFYDMNAVNKAPDGGWTAIDKCHCKNCQTQYLIYAGVDEYRNSCYAITMQGITEILEDESATNRI